MQIYFGLGINDRKGVEGKISNSSADQPPNQSISTVRNDDRFSRLRRFKTEKSTPNVLVDEELSKPPRKFFARKTIPSMMSSTEMDEEKPDLWPADDMKSTLIPSPDMMTPLSLLDSDGFKIPTVPPVKVQRLSAAEASNKLESPPEKMEFLVQTGAVTESAVVLARKLFSQNFTALTGIWCSECKAFEPLTDWSKLILHGIRVHGVEAIMKCRLCEFETLNGQDWVSHRISAHFHQKPSDLLALGYNVERMSYVLRRCFSSTVTAISTKSTATGHAPMVQSRNGTETANGPGEPNGPKRPATSPGISLPLKKRKIWSSDNFMDHQPGYFGTTPDMTDVKSSPMADLWDRIQGYQPALTDWLQCAECDTTVKVGRGDAFKHVFTHLAMDPFECGFCREGFESQEDVESHITKYHDESMNGVLLKSYYKDAFLDSKVLFVEQMEKCFGKTLVSGSSPLPVAASLKPPDSIAEKASSVHPTVVVTEDTSSLTASTETERREPTLNRKPGYNFYPFYEIFEAEIKSQIFGGFLNCWDCGRDISVQSSQSQSIIAKNIVQHVLSHLSALDVPLYKCKICPEIAVIESNMESHVVMSHPGAARISDCYENNIEKYQDKIIDRLRICFVRGISFDQVRSTVTSNDAMT